MQKPRSTFSRLAEHQFETASQTFPEILRFRINVSEEKGKQGQALRLTPGIDNVTVTGSSGSFTVTFAGSQSSTNMGQIFGDAANVTNGSTSRTISTTYNVASEITALSDPSATISYTRDNLGRATSIANTVTGLTPTVTLNQTFDAMNNRTELKAAIGSGNDFKNTYSYDALQRLTEVIQQGQSGGNTVQSKRVAFAYNALGQYTQLARFQSTSTSNAVATSDFTYDTVNRLSTLAHKQSSTTLSDYTYTYDADSRIANVTSSAEGSSTYTYDTSSQVTSADHTSQTDETYGFDANGNRNTTGYTTATNNQTTASPGYTYTYDDEGNRTRRTETSNSHVQEYAWDHRNRLTQVVERNSVGSAITKQVDYEYDDYNRLVKRTYDADGAGAGGSSSQYWIYDEGINAILQFDGAAASNLAHRYLWSNQVDELLADEQVTSLGSAGNALWGLGDHLGTLRDIADFNESTSVTTVTNRRKYNAFGKLTSESNSAVDLLFGFTGKQLDEATGLQHNLFRWYDSSLGKWMSEDPIGFAGKDSNLHRYAANFASKLVDSDGRQSHATGPLRRSEVTDWFNDTPNFETPVANSSGQSLYQPPSADPAEDYNRLRSEWLRELQRRKEVQEQHERRQNRRIGEMEQSLKNLQLLESLRRMLEYMRGGAPRESEDYNSQAGELIQKAKDQLEQDKVKFKRDLMEFNREQRQKLLDLEDRMRGTPQGNPYNGR